MTRTAGRDPRSPAQESVIEWRNVAISPNAVLRFPVGVGESHYYAARITDAAPLVVDGQSQKFLSTVALRPSAFHSRRSRWMTGTFECATSVRMSCRVSCCSSGGTIRYRAYAPFRGESVLAPPSRSGTVADIRRDLERMLVKADLYPSEAAAMVESWRDSWFEEGTRLFYGRFLGPITDRIVARHPDAVARERVREVTNAAFTSLLRRESTCE